MTELGQSRRFIGRPAASGLSRRTDILRIGGHVSNVPTRDMLSEAVNLGGSCASHLWRSHVDGLFEDFHSIAFAN